jgi:hypothetical protein
VTEIKNAIIEAARIDTADRDLLDAWLTLDYGGSGQGFGGYTLYLPKSYKNHGGPNYAGHFLYRVMQVAGVTDWSKVVGRSIRVRATRTGVEAIGHIIKDDWFCPREDFLEMESEYLKGAAHD